MQARKLQRLGHQASTARGTGSILHREIEIPHAAQHSLKKVACEKDEAWANEGSGAGLGLVLC